VGHQDKSVTVLKISEPIGRPARGRVLAGNAMWSRVSGENRADTVRADHVRPLTDP